MSKSLDLITQEFHSIKLRDPVIKPEVRAWLRDYARFLKENPDFPDTQSTKYFLNIQARKWALQLADGEPKKAFSFFLPGETTNFNNDISVQQFLDGLFELIRINVNTVQVNPAVIDEENNLLNFFLTLKNTLSIACENEKNRRDYYVCENTQKLLEPFQKRLSEIPKQILKHLEKLIGETHRITLRSVVTNIINEDHKTEENTCILSNFEYLNDILKNQNNRDALREIDISFNECTTSDDERREEAKADNTSKEIHLPSPWQRFINYVVSFFSNQRFIDIYHLNDDASKIDVPYSQELVDVLNSNHAQPLKALYNFIYEKRSVDDVQNILNYYINNNFENFIKLINTGEDVYWACKVLEHGSRYESIPDLFEKLDVKIDADKLNIKQGAQLALFLKKATTNERNRLTRKYNKSFKDIISSPIELAEFVLTLFEDKPKVIMALLLGNLSLPSIDMKTIFTLFDNVNSDKSWENKASNVQKNEQELSLFTHTIGSYLHLIFEKIPTLSPPNNNLTYLLYRFTAKNRSIVVKNLGGNLSKLVNNPDELSMILEHLPIEDRSSVISVMKDKLSSMINTSLELGKILLHLSPEDQIMLLEQMKDKLPSLIVTCNDLVQILFDLPIQKPNEIPLCKQPKFVFFNMIEGYQFINNLLMSNQEIDMYLINSGLMEPIGREINDGINVQVIENGLKNVAEINWDELNKSVYPYWDLMQKCQMDLIVALGDNLIKLFSNAEPLRLISFLKNFSEKNQNYILTKLGIDWNPLLNKKVFFVDLSQRNSEQISKDDFETSKEVENLAKSSCHSTDAQTLVSLINEGLATYLKRPRAGNNTHLHLFSRIFDSQRGIIRATMYQNMLSANSPLSLKEKLLVAFALFESSKGKQIKIDAASKTSQPKDQVHNTLSEMIKSQFNLHNNAEETLRITQIIEKIMDQAESSSPEITKETFQTEAQINCFSGVFQRKKMFVSAP